MVATRTQTARVTCITKPNRDSAVEAISQIGGAGWKMKVAEAVRAIESKEWSFYTLVNGNRAEIGVRTSSTGKKFLQTHADAKWNNNLLSLPEC